MSRKQSLQNDLLAGQGQLEIFKHSQLLEHGRLLKFPSDTGLSDFGFGQLQQVDARVQTMPFLNRAGSCR